MVIMSLQFMYLSADSNWLDIPMWNKILRYLPCLRELPIKIKLILLTLHCQHTWVQADTHMWTCMWVHTPERTQTLYCHQSYNYSQIQTCPKELTKKKKIKPQNKEPYTKSSSEHKRLMLANLYGICTRMYFEVLGQRRKERSFILGLNLTTQAHLAEALGLISLLNSREWF